MECKGCHSSHTEVVYTRNYIGDNRVIRRRMCTRCGLRFTTCEDYREIKRPPDPKLTAD